METDLNKELQASMDATGWRIPQEGFALTPQEIHKDLTNKLSSTDGRLNNMAKAFKEILDKVDALTVSLQEQPRIAKTYIKRDNQSPAIGKIALALSKAQGSMKLVSATGKVGMGDSKSADLGDLMLVAVPALEAHELALLFCIENNEYGEGTIEAKLVHSSGEWFSSCQLLREDETMPQEREYQKKRNAATTYCMKNMYRTMLGMGKE